METMIAKALISKPLNVKSEPYKNSSKLNESAVCFLSNLTKRFHSLAFWDVYSVIYSYNQRVYSSVYHYKLNVIQKLANYNNSKYYHPFFNKKTKNALQMQAKCSHLCKLCGMNEQLDYSIQTGFIFGF